MDISHVNPSLNAQLPILSMISTTVAHLLKLMSLAQNIVITQTSQLIFIHGFGKMCDM